MKAKHTPGPWKVRAFDDGKGKYPDYSHRERTVFTVNAAPDRPDLYSDDMKDNARIVAECGEDGEANARLIAASPELFAGLSRAVEYFEANGGEMEYSWLPRMKAALKKAKGGR